MSNPASRSRPGPAARLLALLLLLAQLAAGVLPHTHALVQSGERIGGGAADGNGIHATFCPACVVAHSPASPGGQATPLPSLGQLVHPVAANAAEPVAAFPPATRSRAPPLSA